MRSIREYLRALTVLRADGAGAARPHSRFRANADRAFEFPLLQGARLTAWEMVQERIPVTLVTDNMAGHLMQRGAVDLVVVGADRVAVNGDVVNKIGTYSLAAHHGLPFYVAAPLSTIDLNVPDGNAIPIEERSPAEVTGFRGEHWAPEGVAVMNPAFDMTPAALVTGLITERGVVAPLDADGIRRLFAAT